MNAPSIAPKKIAAKVMNQEKINVLDVRDEEAAQDWKIEGERVHLINIPLEKFKNGSQEDWKDLPREEPLYTVCPRGNKSQQAAEILTENGFNNVYSIEGGMAAWSEQLEPVKIGETAGGSIYQFNRLGKGCLSYLIESDGEAAVVDANRMTEIYENFAREKGITIKHVIDTHLHADHISGGRKLAQHTGASYYLPADDAEEVVFDFVTVNDGMKIDIGKTSMEAFYSPGHTIGSTTFIVEGKYALTGDILFIESIGRPDLAGKAKDWAKDLYGTLFERYHHLSEELLVLPGHYSNMGEMNEDGSVAEKLTSLYEKNEGLQVKSESAFLKKVTEGLKDQPNEHEEIRQTNMGRVNPDPEKVQEMETGPNNCAV